IEGALRVVTDARVGKEIGEVMPQTQFGVMAVGMLKPFDRRDGFDTLRQRLEPIDALLQRGEIGVGVARARPERRRLRPAHDARGCERHYGERAADDEAGYAWLHWPKSSGRGRFAQRSVRTRTLQKETASKSLCPHRHA